MELALQFENLNCEELCAIDGGKSKTFKKIVHNVGDFFIGVKDGFLDWFGAC